VTTPEPADDGQLPPRENSPSSDAPSGGLEGSVPGQSPEPVSSESPANPDEGLPEWEPLTPEIVEDEAIRGDFVIRWAIVGLALLFGLAPINDTRTLVHIKSGEYLASHGILPPARDVFSSTAGDRRWVNLSWLFDLVAAGVHGVAGGIGLSIVQGLLAGVTFGLLVHAYRPGIRTWWGSVCAALALLACYPQFTAQPELITLAGLAVVLWIVVRASESGNSRLLWASVGVIWIWSQLDSRAFLGWILLVALSAGELLRRDDQAPQRRKLWWRVALASLAVTVIHPFLWESWLSPIRVYAMDYAGLRQEFPRPGMIEIGYFPIWFTPFWISINHVSVAALVLFVATAISLILNRERLHPGHLVAFVVFNLFGCLATHELAVASLVNCVLCTLNAQTWYQHRFGQVYSIDWRELLFSRGGRAVTVFCFFALAWLEISGRIDGPSGRRTGLGFHELLQVQMDSYQQVAGPNTSHLDDRPFHFAPRQGDLLIWTGQKSFIDMRAGLFVGSGDDNLIALHDRTRRAIQLKRTTQEGSGEPEVWKGTFEKYQLTHTMPRLSGPIPAPDYITFGDLLTSREWVLTDMSASTCVFYRDVKTPTQSEYVAQHRMDFVKQAFRAEAPTPETTRVCARAATLSDSLFSVRQPHYPAGIQLAAHYVQLARARGDFGPELQAAFAILAIRNATAGLREDPNSADGYRILGLAYMVLDRVETSLMNEAGIRWFSAVRYYQTVAALQQAVLLKPDDEMLREDLLGVFRRSQRGELALEMIHEIKRIHPVTAESTEEERKQREPLVKMEFALDEMMSKIDGFVEQSLSNGDRFQVAVAAYQAGAVRLAIKTLEDDPIYVEQNPLAKSVLGAWLIEVGRVQEGIDSLEQASGKSPDWRDSVATSMLINGEYSRSIELWREQFAESNTTSIQAALLTLPFLTLNPMWMTSDQYPFTHMGAVAEVLGNVQAEKATLAFQIGLAQLEQGDVAAARKSFQDVYDGAPYVQLRPIVRFYLEQLTDTRISMDRPELKKIDDLEPMDDEPVAKKVEAK